MTHTQLGFFIESILIATFSNRFLTTKRGAHSYICSDAGSAGECSSAALSSGAKTDELEAACTRSSGGGARPRLRHRPQR
jgi:hypothetical protein